MKLRISLITAALWISVAGCEQQKAEASAEPVSASAADPATKNKADESVKTVLRAYEKIRAILADDKTKDLAASAEELSKSSAAAAAQGSAESKKHFEALSKTASDLKEKSAAGIDEARLAYGEVSRHLVALLTADPSLRKGLHVFECPMAAGYKKWVQKDAKISNPYMGKKMPRCGGESEWASAP